MFMEGVGRGRWRWVGDGDRICPPPFPNPSPRTLLRRASATCGAVGGMTRKQSEAGRRGVIKRMGQSGGHGRVKCEDRTVLRGRDQIKIDGDRVSNMEGGGEGGVGSVLCAMPRLQAPNRGQWNGP